MDSVGYYGSAGQHVELSSLSQALIVPLKSGLSSFITVSGILLSINGDMVFPGSQSFDDIIRQITNMKQQMERSAHIANTELQRVDKATVTLTAEQSQLVWQKRQKTNELNNLKTHLSSLQSTLSSYDQALDAARRNLRSAEYTLNDMRAKEEEAERTRDIGYGLLAIPVLGWIAGGIMAGVGQTDMDRFSEAADTARREVEYYESRENLYYNQVQQYYSLIYQAKRDITGVDNKIRQTEAKLRDMSVKRRVVADIQDKIRRAVTHLGLLSGVGSVVALQTRRLILLEPVMNVLEQMTSILGQISGNDLLYSEGILSLMEVMKKNHRKLKELGDTNMSPDNDYI